MKRLLKFVTITFLSVTFLMPLLECFDTWDRPGLTNDTEFPVFLFVLFIALVLVIATVIAGLSLARQNGRTMTEVVYEFVLFDVSFWQDIILPPVLSPPLRT